MNKLLLTLLFGLFGSCAVFSAEASKSNEQQSQKFTVPITLPNGTTVFKEVDEAGYRQWYSQQQRLQQRQQMQQQIQNQLQNLRSGGSSGGGAGGGGGGGSSKGQSSNSSNAIKPLEASAFGQIPNFSSGPSQQALQQLVAQSAQEDTESKNYLETIKQQIEEKTKKTMPSSKVTEALTDFNQLLMETLATIQSLPSSLSTNEKLLRSANITKRRRIIGRPLDVPTDKGIVVGQSLPSVLSRRALASIAQGSHPKKPEVLEEALPRRKRVLRSIHLRR